MGEGENKSGEVLSSLSEPKYSWYSWLSCLLCGDVGLGEVG